MVIFVSGFFLYNSFFRMAKKKKKQHRGYYCSICGDCKPNEKFSGKGHAKHICKECEALPQECKNELRYISLIDRAAWKYPRSRQDWELLEKMAKNKKYPEAMEYAQSILENNNKHSTPEDIEEDMDDWDNPVEGNIGELFRESLSFSEFDEDSQEEIRDALREDIYDIICYSGALLKVFPYLLDEQILAKRYFFAGSNGFR